jgi:hypothetical protein
VTKGSVPLVGLARFAQNPIEVSVSPGSSWAFHEQHGVTLTTPLEPLKLPFHELAMVEAFVFRLTAKLVAFVADTFVTFSTAQ